MTFGYFMNGLISVNNQHSFSKSNAIKRMQQGFSIQINVKAQFARY